MKNRIELQALLEELLGSDRVYFQPPDNMSLLYPCIVYERNDTQTSYANNKPYTHLNRYTVTIIDRDPDSSIPAKVAELPLCSSDRFFTADNLNHDVYSLYF